MRYAVLAVLAACGANNPAGPGTQPTAVPASTGPTNPQLEQMKSELAACRQTHAETKKLVVALQDENATLRRDSKPAPPPVLDDATARKASQEFIDVVRNSRQAMLRCFADGVAKKAIPKQAVTLTITAAYTATATFGTLDFSPSLGDVFEGCIRKTATAWTLSKGTPAMTFKTTVALAP